jgi:membrane associated rhomboid family serine protease
VIRQEDTSITKELKSQAQILGSTTAGLWVVEIIDTLLRHGLDRFGIHPRNADWVWGILFAPFLHGSFEHLISNTVPFIILGWLIMIRDTKEFFTVSAITAITAGLGVWLFGAPNSVHIGASGVVFGYLGFLLLRGYFERSLYSILLSVGVGVLYGGVLWGVLPGQAGISWEGHLFGFLGGVLAAKWLAKPKTVRT